MNMELLGNISNAFFFEITLLVNGPLGAESARSQMSIAGCSHSNEHWFAIRLELDNELYSAAVFSHRAQKQALIRAIWHAFKSDENELRKFNSDYSLEDDCQLALMAPLDMITTWVACNGLVDGESPVEHMHHDVSEWFRQSILKSWQPLPRHDVEYPMSSLMALQRDSNGLLLMSMMHTFLLNEDVEIEYELLALAIRFKECLPIQLAEKMARWQRTAR